MFNSPTCEKEIIIFVSVVAVATLRRERGEDSKNTFSSGEGCKHLDISKPLLYVISAIKLLERDRSRIPAFPFGKFLPQHRAATMSG